ncbi:centrosomal protein of 44 kDa isoform 3-T5 [Callospermophilus lateralis]|uniref:centrosomal protein of 44 kDa isoform X3 n=1 Tax=Callospermophilus lateralis TaxID=76772 RepID=UPI004038903D
MATGDLKRSLRNLEQVLRLLNYPEEVDCVGLVKGDTAASLPIISYSLTSYSPYVTELLMESNVELIAKNDLRFIDTVYKTPSQQRKKSIAGKSEPCSSNEKALLEPVSIDVTTGRFLTSGKKKAVVIRHLYNEDNVDIPEATTSSVADTDEAFDMLSLKPSEINIPEENVPEIKDEQKDVKVNLEITALQTILAECQEKLNKLPSIEKRLDCLEEAMKGKVMVDETTWTNLLSRVTLLETELLLSKKNEYIDLNVVSEECASGSDVDLQTLDRKSEVEASANIPLSSGYSTETDSTPRASTVIYSGLKETSEETTIQKLERMKKMFEETAELLKCSSH